MQVMKLIPAFLSGTKLPLCLLLIIILVSRVLPVNSQCSPVVNVSNFGSIQISNCHLSPNATRIVVYSDSTFSCLSLRIDVSNSTIEGIDWSFCLNAIRNVTINVVAASRVLKFGVLQATKTLALQNVTVRIANSQILLASSSRDVVNGATYESSIIQLERTDNSFVDNVVLSISASRIVRVATQLIYLPLLGFRAVNLTNVVISMQQVSCWLDIDVPGSALQADTEELKGIVSFRSLAFARNLSVIISDDSFFNISLRNPSKMNREYQLIVFVGHYLRLATAHIRDVHFLVTFTMPDWTIASQSITVGVVRLDQIIPAADQQTYALPRSVADCDVVIDRLFANITTARIALLVNVLWTMDNISIVVRNSRVLMRIAGVLIGRTRSMTLVSTEVLRSSRIVVDAVQTSQSLRLGGLLDSSGYSESYMKVLRCVTSTGTTIIVRNSETTQIIEGGYSNSFMATMLAFNTDAGNLYNSTIIVENSVLRHQFSPQPGSIGIILLTSVVYVTSGDSVYLRVHNVTFRSQNYLLPAMSLTLLGIATIVTLGYNDQYSGSTVISVSSGVVAEITDSSFWSNLNSPLTGILSTAGFLQNVTFYVRSCALTDVEGAGAGLSVVDRTVGLLAIANVSTSATSPSELYCSLIDCVGSSAYLYAQRDVPIPFLLHVVMKNNSVQLPSTSTSAFRFLPLQRSFFNVTLEQNKISGHPRTVVFANDTLWASPATVHLKCGNQINHLLVTRRQIAIPPQILRSRPSLAPCGLTNTVSASLTDSERPLDVVRARFAVATGSGSLQSLAVLALTFLNWNGAVSLQRSFGVSRILQCASAEEILESPVDISSSPLQWSFGTARGAAFRGNIAGNILLCVAIATLGGFVTMLASWRHGWVAWRRAVVLASPLFVFPLVAVLLPPIASSGTTLLSAQPALPADVFWGIFAFLFSLMIVALVGKVVAKSSSQFQSKAIRRARRRNKNISAKRKGLSFVEVALAALRTICDAHWRWEDRKKGSTFTAVFGALFDGYSKRFHWWSVVDLVFAVMLAVLSGVVARDPGVCDALLYLLCFLCSLLLLVTLKLMVFNSYLDLSQSLLGNATTVLLAGLALSSQEEAMNSVVTVQTALTFASCGIWLIFIVMEKTVPLHLKQLVDNIFVRRHTEKESSTVSESSDSEEISSQPQRKVQQAPSSPLQKSPEQIQLHLEKLVRTICAAQRRQHRKLRERQRALCQEIGRAHI